MHKPVSRRFSRSLCAALLALVFLPSSVARAVQFQQAQTLQSGINFSTIVAIGPEDPDPNSNADGCVYAGRGLTGTVNRICFNSLKSVTSNTVVINLNGGTTSLADVNGLLGIAFDPMSNPKSGGEIHLYLAYADNNASPFNGKIARAVSSNGGVSYTVNEDFIVGLPHSSFNHQTNGLAFGREPDDCLYIAQGGNSNTGFDIDFAESRLSGAILRACFKNSDGSVNSTFDRNCGGGSSQQACGLEVYAAGLRNPFDLLFHSNGFLYATDNDANTGFRDSCPASANPFGCACESSPPSDPGDEINLIEQGKYYGSPNPYRANPTLLQCQGGSGTTAGDACSSSAQCAGGGSCLNLGSLCTDAICNQDVQCLYFRPTDNPTTAEDPNGLYRAPISAPTPDLLLDGIAEYRPPFMNLLPGGFCSDWNGKLLVAPTGGDVFRYTLSADGHTATSNGLVGYGAKGLDVVVGADGTAYFSTVDDNIVRYIKPIVQSGATNHFVHCPPRQTCVDNSCIPVCVGDCNVNQSVAINELLTDVNISLGNTPLYPKCPAGDANNDGSVMVSELVQAVDNALSGCSGAGGGGLGALTTVIVDIGAGTGPRGGSASVPISISGGGGAVAGAQVDILFSQTAFSVANPSTNCIVASRLASGYQISASLPTSPPPPAGKKRLRVIVLPDFDSVSGFTDGLIATCTFQISTSAATGTHTLQGDRQEVSNTSGSAIGSTVDNGSILVQ